MDDAILVKDLPPELNESVVHAISAYTVAFVRFEERNGRRHCTLPGSGVLIAAAGVKSVRGARQLGRHERSRSVASSPAEEGRHLHDSCVTEAAEPQQMRVAGDDEIRVDLLGALEDAIVCAIMNDREMW